MATFKPVTRTKKEYNTVYIRLTHGAGKVDYIRTEMSVHKSAIRKGEITDHVILANCAIKIKSYIDKVNNTNIEKYFLRLNFSCLFEIKHYLCKKRCQRLIN